MGSRFEESNYQMLSREPVTANEVAKKLEVTQDDDADVYACWRLLG